MRKTINLFFVKDVHGKIENTFSFHSGNQEEFIISLLENDNLRRLFYNSPLIGLGELYTLLYL